MLKDIDPYFSMVCKICRHFIHSNDHADAYIHLMREHPKIFSQLQKEMDSNFKVEQDLFECKED